MAGQGLWQETDKNQQLLFNTGYRYDKNGVAVAESTNCMQVSLAQRQLFNARGFLVEWQRFTALGTIESKAFIGYNAQGDPLRISQYYASPAEWVKREYDGYVYDAHGNWTERAVYILHQVNGNNVRTLTGMQYRALTYREKSNGH